MQDLNELARQVGAQLEARGWRIALAESCTGGMLSHVLTNASGSSAYVLGGVVAYANEVKRDVLGVPEELLARYGAVSEPAARAMAEGVRRLLGAEVGVSITGVAGPTGGTPEKPVGTVYIGLAWAEGLQVAHHVWEERDRLRNKERSVEAALEMVRALLGS